MIKNLTFVIFTLLTITGCSQKIDCGSDNTATVISDSIKEKIKNSAAQMTSAGMGSISQKLLSEMLPKFEPHMTLARTTSKDSTTNKSNCAGNLTFKFPEQISSDAEKYYKPGFLPRVAIELGLIHTNDSISIPLVYSVQPTDDGKNLYVEFTKPDSISDWIMFAIAFSQPRQVSTDTQEKTQSTSNSKQQTTEKNYKYFQIHLTKKPEISEEGIHIETDKGSYSMYAATATESVRKAFQQAEAGQCLRLQTSEEFNFSNASYISEVTHDCQN